MSSLIFVESTDGTFSFSLKPAVMDGPTALSQNTDLKLYGTGTYGWSNGYSQNFFRLLENFACEEKILSGKPVPLEDVDLGLNKGINQPVIGQAWFNKTRNQLYTFDGTDWVSVNPLEIGTTTPSSPYVGQLWFDTADNYTSPVNDYAPNGILKMYNGTAFVDVAAPIVDTLYPRTGGTVYGSVATGGETSPDVDVGGICINHGSSDGRALTFKNTDVSHPFVSYDSDTYGFVQKYFHAGGGLSVSGLSTGGVGIELRPFCGIGVTSSTSGGALTIDARKNSVGVPSTFASNENIVAIRNYTNGNIFLIKGNGDLTIAGDITAVGNISGNSLTATGSISGSDLTISGLATSNASLISITNNNHLTTKEYVDNEITTVVANELYEPTLGNWHNNGILKVHNDGGTEVGSYLDFHIEDSDVTNFDARLEAFVNGLNQNIRLRGSDASKANFTLDCVNGIVSFRSDQVAGFQTVTFTDARIENDVNFPGGQTEYLIFSKYNETKGGARIRGYYKNGVNQNAPALFLEGCKDDNGQIDNEFGAVTVNSFRLSGGVPTTVVNTDNLFAVTNHTTAQMVVKGDGKVILPTNPAITQSNQLTTKQYVDSLYSGVPAIDLYSVYSDIFINQAVNGAAIVSGNFNEVHTVAKGIYIVGIADFGWTDNSGVGWNEFTVSINLRKNTIVVDNNSSTYFIESSGFNPNEALISLPITVSHGNTADSAGTYDVEVTISYEQNQGNVVLDANIRLNYTIYR